MIDLEKLRPGMPPLPSRMMTLNLDERGYPVPFFVQWIDGKPDFRVVDGRKLREAVAFKLCWLCGQPLGRVVTYVIGPMCAVNRVSSEPPSHTECADFAARACPFLTRPKAERREANKPDGLEKAAGFGVDRNPGVALLWTTREPLHAFRAHAGSQGILFRVGEPDSIVFLAEGRPATRQEILDSLLSGVEILRAMARKDGPEAEVTLDRQTQAALALVPA